MSSSPGPGEPGHDANHHNRRTIMAVSLFAITMCSIAIIAPNLRMSGVGQISIRPAAATSLTEAAPTLATDLPAPLANRAGSLDSILKELKSLKEQNRRLKDELVAAKQSQKCSTSWSLSPDEGDPSSVCLDMVRFLGDIRYYTGPGYDPYKCFPPLNTVFNVSTSEIDGVVSRLRKDLCAAMAQLRGVRTEDIRPEEPWWAQPISPQLRSSVPKYPTDHSDAIKMVHRDPLFAKWRVEQVRVLARYIVFADGTLVAECPESPGPQKLDTLGTSKSCFKDLPPEQMAEAYGYHMMPWASPQLIAREAVTLHTCSMPIKNHTANYMDWLKKYRMRTPEWKTFHVDNYEEDNLLLLFDIMYELKQTFTKQYWQGVITMQNPFDMYAIQDIIFNQRPDLIIETGTANGGSALLWASIMELSEIEGGRVVTVDVNTPDWKLGQSWGGEVRRDPTQHRLWKKRVTFIKGGSTDAATVAAIKAQAAKATRVMVLLDSGHHGSFVLEEMNTYCPLVSVGGYCVVEDVKLSRWTTTGPLEAIRSFVAANPNWVIDRDRELLFTHHPSGYLQRKS